MTARSREADTIRVPALPHTTGLRAWRSSVRAEVTAASGRGHVAFKWVREVERDSATFSGLSDSAGLESLDAKLASALTKVLSGELGRKVSQATEKEAKMDRPIAGRQILFMIYHHYKTNEEAGALYDLADLMAVKWQGDGNLESFLHTWDSVLLGMREEPPEHYLEILFHTQVRNSAVLREEIAHYERARKGHPDRTYAFLTDTVRRYLDRRRQDVNRKAMVQSLGRANPALPASLSPASSRNEGKKKEEGKDKRKGTRSASRRKRREKAERSKDRGRSGSPGRGGSPKRAASPSGKGKGRGDHGSSSHGKPNSPRGGSPRGDKDICFGFQKGRCKWGSKCRYKHVQPDGGKYAERQKKSKDGPTSKITPPSSPRL